MKSYETTSNGYELIFQGPATSPEFNELAKGRKEADPCCEDAVENTLNRSTVPVWQKAFIPLIESLSGLARGVDEKLTAARKANAKDPANVSDVKERFRAFNDRVRKHHGDNKDLLAELDLAAQACADGIIIDPSATTRVSGINKRHYDKADSILDESDEVVESKVEKLTAIVSDYDLVRDEHNRPERESLARLIALWYAAL